MTLDFPMRFGILRQRGFWLRCFLGLPAGVLWALAVCGSLQAQIEIPGPIHLTHVSGVVVNSLGKPVSHVKVTLSQDERVAYSTQTNTAGAFDFDHVSGRYRLRVARSEYAPATREIYAGNEIVTYLQRKRLYVILGPGACSDECSSFFTSKHAFERALRNKSRH